MAQVKRLVPWLLIVVFVQTKSTFSQLWFSDAAKTSNAGQLCYLAGLLVDDMQCRSIFQTIAWTLHKAKRAVKLADAAETLSAGGAIDLGRGIATPYRALLNGDTDLVIAVDSKDFLNTLTTQQQSKENPIRCGVSAIR